MDREIEDAIESAYRMEREHGFLCLESMRTSATFVAVRRLAETGDPSVIRGCPGWLLAELNDWKIGFRESGCFGFVSNLGEVDHSALMTTALNVLEEDD